MAASLYHRQLSTEGQPLIALHGLFGALENLGVICRELANEYAVYALDLPNHGRSESIINPTLASFADAVVAWMAQCDIDKAHFLGHSLGGKVAMEIALRYPEKVDLLIVADIAPVNYPRRHDDVFAALKAVTLPSLASRVEADQQMQVYIDEPSTRSFLLKNLIKDSDGNWSWRIDIDCLYNAYPDLIAANTDSAPSFMRPVLFIKGELSPYILPEHEASVVSRFPNTSVKVISGTQHWLHVEKPAIFVGIVRRFLAETV